MNATANKLGVIRGIDTGCSNYGTWTVNLWLGCDGEAFSYWRGVAREVRREVRNCPQVFEQLWTEEHAARFLLADRLEEEICDGALIEHPGLYSDLLRLALAEFDWQQVAETFLDLP